MLLYYLVYGIIYRSCLFQSDQYCGAPVWACYEITTKNNKYNNLQNYELKELCNFKVIVSSTLINALCKHNIIYTQRNGYIK